MSAINSEEVETAGTNVTERKSLQGINVYSPPSALPRLCVKKSSYDAEGKDCVVSKIPRPAMTASYSFNETIKSNQSIGKTKRTPSMIPRSKSRKRNEMGKMRIDIPSKAESPKRYFKKPTGSNSKELSEVPPEDEFELFVSPMENENKMSKQEISRMSFKSCQDDFKDVSYTEGQEEVFSASPTARKEEEIKGPPEEENFGEENGGEEVVEEEREARTIRHLYETIKCTVGSLFEDLKWTHPEKFKGKGSEISFDSTLTELVDGTESLSESSSIQEHYNFTLKEISNIWKSSLSLLGSVTSHAVKFVEEKDQLIDKEQLALEAEMLQATLDFAISYSKLKTEFLITMVKERLNISDSGVNKLENLMDSKVFATFYNVEDLASMAQNVHDLSASLRAKGEDLDVD